MPDGDDPTKRLAACYTGAVHDVMRALGNEAFVLPPDIRPVQSNSLDSSWRPVP